MVIDKSSINTSCQFYRDLSINLKINSLDLSDDVPTFSDAFPGTTKIF